MRVFYPPGPNHDHRCPYRRHLIVRSGFAQLLGLEPDLQVLPSLVRGARRWRGCRGAVCSVYLRYLHARYLRSGAAKPAPKGMATIMLSVHDSPALVEQRLTRGRAAFSPSVVALTN